MPKLSKKKTKYENVKFSTYIDDWYSGRTKHFLPGDVVRYKHDNNKIGIIANPCHEIDYYEIKIYEGPNPWNFYWANVHYSKIEKTDIKNPTSYSVIDKYPGPSNHIMKALNEKFYTSTDKQKSSLEVERELEIIEEEKFKRKQLELLEDKVVTEEDDIEESTVINTSIDSKELKRIKIMDEE